MDIRLKNIGIIKKSEIKLDGLTVITGDNSSGKTTVGKVLYSLIDSVSNLNKKYEEDVFNYVSKQLDELFEVLDVFLIRQQDSVNSSTLLENYPSVFALMSKTRMSGYRRRFTKEFFGDCAIEEFLFKLKDELQLLSADSLIDSNEFHSRLKYHYMRMNVHTREEFSDKDAIVDKIKDQISYAISIIDRTLSVLNNDPNLVDYVRTSIDRTLKVEFSKQIQPVKYPNLISNVSICDKSTLVFSLDIRENNVVDDAKPVFANMLSIKNVFLIDNPFVLDAVSYGRMFLVHETEGDSTVFNPNRIVPHEFKLSRSLRTIGQETVLETLVADKKYKLIKEKINEVLSGDFEFSSDKEIYVDDGVPINLTNLATGSKMFAILKILIEKGEINDKTMLILDEPEAHLHPSWQNKFAEIIVMIAKELGTNILLTTHSPNFVLAIDAYMRKYDIPDMTNFYQTRHIDDYYIEYVNVNDDIGLIYDDFSKYLAEVKGLRDKFFFAKGDNCDE